jgi:hypothetical protein
MKLNLGLCALSIAAVLATAPAALAASAAVGGDTGVSVGTSTGDASTSTGANANADANANANGTVSTDHGMSALGVDISQAGDTTNSVQSFTSNLTSDQQAQLKTRCDKVLASPSSANSDVLAFCKNSKM